MMSREQLHHLSGAYVLNALDEEERESFASCLPDWDEMRAEVTELADTAAALGLAVQPVAPSAELRARLLAEAAETPQWTPEPAPRHVASHRAERHARRIPGTLPSTRRSSRPLRPLALLIGMTAVVLAGVLAVTLGRGILLPQDARPVSFAQLEDAGDSRRMPVVIPGGAGIEVVASDRLDAAAIAWTTLPPLPADHVYELWYVDGSPRPAGVLTASRGKPGVQVLDGELGPRDSIALTVEPAGGSDQPTTAPLVVVDPA